MSTHSSCSSYFSSGGCSISVCLREKQVRRPPAADGRVCHVYLPEPRWGGGGGRGGGSRQLAAVASVAELPPLSALPKRPRTPSEAPLFPRVQMPTRLHHSDHFCRICVQLLMSNISGGFWSLKEAESINSRSSHIPPLK